MTEEQSIQWMVDYLAAHPDADGAQLVKALQDAGMSQAESSRAFNFTQMAWARLMLEQLGVVLTDYYTCFNAHGEVVAQGKLTEDSQYATALRLAPGYQAGEPFQKLALQSHEARQIYDMLKSGIAPNQIGTNPVYIMLETPTAEGIQRAQAYVDSRVGLDNARIKAAAERAAASAATAEAADPVPEVPASEPPPAKPWWKFW